MRVQPTIPLSTAIEKARIFNLATMGKPKSRTTASDVTYDGPGRPANNALKKVTKPADYTSDGVEDHDVFLLPGSDYQIMFVLTLLAAVVRLFRIYQPSSVVFDEVQYVTISARLARITPLTITVQTALAALRPSTSRANSLWMSTPLLQNCF